MKGAAYSGLRNIVPTSRLCRRHYGFAWSKPFLPELHAGYETYYEEWAGALYVDGMLEWALKKVPHRACERDFANS